MEQYNLSWTWNAKGGAWKIMVSFKGGDDEQSQVFAIFCVLVCTHVYAWFQIKYATRNKSYAKGKAWSWPRHYSFILNPKFRWSLADDHKHSHQSKYKRCDGSTPGTLITSAAADVINHNGRQIGRFKPILFCYARIKSAQSWSRRHHWFWADVILTDFQRVISRYLQDISPYLSCTAQRVLITICMQKSKPKYACLPSKIVEVWIDRFCVRYDWWRRLQPTSSVSPVWMEDLPVVSTRPSHSLCSQGVPIAAVLFVTYQNYFCAG